MTSKITADLERMTGVAATGAVFMARLVHRSGSRHAPVNLFSNKLLSLAPARVAFDKEGTATLDLVQTRYLPAGWSYDIIISGKGAGDRAIVFDNVAVPNTDRRLDQVLGQLEPGRVPRFALITNEQLDALIANHGIGILTQLPLSGSGRQGDPVTIADGAIASGKLEKAVRDILEGAVQITTVVGGVGRAGEENQITFATDGGTERVITLPTDGITMARVLNALTGGFRLSYNSLKDTPAVPSGGHAGQDDVAALTGRVAENEDSIEDLQLFEGALRADQAVLTNGMLQVVVSGSATRFSGRPKWPVAQDDSEYTVTVGGAATGSERFKESDLFAKGAVSQATQLDATNAVELTFGSVKLFFAHEGDRTILAASDTGGTYTITISRSRIQVKQEQLDPAISLGVDDDAVNALIDAAVPPKRRIPDFAIGDAGEAVKVNATGTGLVIAPESGGGAGTDEARVNELIASAVEDFAETGKPSARIPESRLPRKDDDLLDAVDERGWTDEGSDAATDIWVANAVTAAAPASAAAAAALVFVQSFQQNVRQTNYFATIRVPTSITLGDEDRLAHGTESLGTTGLPAADWTDHGVVGSYRYYSIQIPDLVAGETVRAQRFEQFHFDPARIENVLPINAADGQTVAWNAANNRWEPQEPASGGGGGGSHRTIEETQPAAATLRMPANGFLGTSWPTSAGQPLWQTLMETAALTAAQASGGGIDLEIKAVGTSAASTGGGDRIYAGMRIVRVRGANQEQVVITRDYVRNSGQMSADLNEASRRADFDLRCAIAADDLEAGDILRVQVRGAAQVAGRNYIEWLQADNKLKLITPAAGGGVSAPVGPATAYAEIKGDLVAATPALPTGALARNAYFGTAAQFVVQAGHTSRYTTHATNAPWLNIPPDSQDGQIGIIVDLVVAGVIANTVLFPQGRTGPARTMAITAAGLGLNLAKNPNVAAPGSFLVVRSTGNALPANTRILVYEARIKNTPGPRGAPGRDGERGRDGADATNDNSVLTTAAYAALRTAGTTDPDTIYFETGSQPPALGTPTIDEPDAVAVTGSTTQPQTTGISIPASGIFAINTIEYASTAPNAAISDVANETIQARVLRALPAVPVQGTALAGANSMTSAHGRFARSAGGHLMFQPSSNRIRTLFVALVS